MLVLLAILGCQPIPPQSMTEVAFAEDFELETRQKVTLHFAGNGDEGGLLGLSQEDGGPLLEGRLEDLLGQAREILVQPDNRELLVTVRNSSGTSHWSVDIPPGAEDFWIDVDGGR